MPSQKPERPDTSLLDAAREQAEALAQYEQDVREYEKRQAEQAEAKAKTERLAHQRKCRDACARHVLDAEKAVVALTDALDRYIAASEYSPYQLSGRIGNFLGGYVRKYGPIDGRSPVGNDLMVELFPEVDRG